METINQRVRKYRKELFLSQADVAGMLGMKTSTYSQMERMGNITCETLLKLAEIFKVDALKLLYGEDMPKKEIKDIKEFKADIDGVGMIVAQDVYEKFAVIAMRNLSQPLKQEVYEFILDELKNVKEFKLYNK